MVSCRVDLVKEVGFLVKELVKEKDHEVNEDHGKIDFPGSFLTKSEFLFLILVEACWKMLCMYFTFFETLQ